jgi:hypothetical protein
MFGIRGVSHEFPIHFCSKELHHVIVQSILMAGSSVIGSEKSTDRKSGLRKTSFLAVMCPKSLNDVHFRLDRAFYEAVRSQAADIN